MGYPGAARDRLDRLFPVLAHSPEDRLFFLEKRALGFGFLCVPLAGGDDGLMSRFNNLLNLEWPVETLLQFCLYASPDLLPERILLEGSGEVPEFLRELRTARMEFLRRAAQTPLDGGGLLLRDLKLLVTARLPISLDEPTDRDVRTALNLQNGAQESLKSCGFAVRKMTVEDYVRFMETVLNWDPAAAWRGCTTVEVDANRLIREQLADYGNRLQVFSNHLRLGDKVVKVLSPKRIPDTVFFGLAQRYLTDPLTGGRGVRENVLINANVYFPDTERLRGKLEKERQWVANQTYGPLLKFVPRLAKKKESYDVLFQSLEDGDRLVRLMLSVVLFCDPENAVGATANLQAFWRESGFLMLEDRFVCLPVFLNSLPFGAEPEVVGELYRYHTMGARQALPFLPVFGSWQGSGTSAMQFVGRDGQLTFFDLFDSTTNFNAVIAAQSGSGKSFLTNEMILQYLSLGGRAWVLDIGRSYEKLAQVLGGTFMVFDAQSDICLNPFSLVKDYDEDSDTLAGLVTAMAAPTVPLDDFQKAGLQRVLGEVWKREGPEMSVDSLAEALKREPGLKPDDTRLKDIGEQLYAFTSQGPYGRFFNGPNNVDFQGRLTVIELEELRGRKHLQQVVLLQMIFQIQHDMYLGERDRPKLVIIDEAWDLLTQGNVAEFIEHGYRRFRKYGGAAVSITQSINDLYNSKSGVAIAENSAVKILLGQARETVGKLKQDGKMDLGEYGFELLKTVHTVPGRYSELCFVSEGGPAVARLYVEPFKKLLYSTKAEDVHALKQMQAQGLSLAEAINALAATREPAGGTGAQLCVGAG
jgi:conjugal transfer ATP-binding protein TraC